MVIMVTQTVSAWILTSLVLVAAYPWSVWLLARSPQSHPRLLTVLLTLALATGTLSLVMFWMSLTGVRFETWAIAWRYFAVMLPGWVLGGWKRRFQSIYQAGRTSPLQTITGLTLLMVGAAILFNAVYWPFSRDDAVAIYAAFGARMAEQAAIIPLPGNDTLYEAYPVHIPLIYTFAYLASGWTNEYLARLFPTLMSVGCIAAAYLLGSMIHGAGLASAFLLVITPTFGRWASSGYVDLPMAFLIILSAVFAWRLWESRHWTDALLAGLTMGLAAWTKNAALISVLSLATWLLWAWFKGCLRWHRVALALTACVFVAAPWYARNLIEAGLLIPDTVWTEQARASLDNLLILPRLYGLPGVVLLIGFVLTGVNFVRRFDVPQSVLLLLWSVPLFVAWWIFASYDPRFILLILPILCVMAGGWIQKVLDAVPDEWRNRLVWPAAALVVVLGLYSAWNSVEFKDAILRDPFMGDAAKQAVTSRER